MTSRPLPAVGDRVKLDYGLKNPNTWWRWGVVRFVDSEVILVKRWIPRKGWHHWTVIEASEWATRPYLHKPKRGEPIPLTDKPGEDDQ